MAGRTKLEPRLTQEELKQRYRSADDRSERSHFHILWLISTGHTQAETARAVGMSERWVQEVVKRYNEGGVEAMRDRRHDHPGPAPVLDSDGEKALENALLGRPDDGGVWTSNKAAAWIGKRTGRKVSRSSAWRALRRTGHTPQRPRPQHRRADPQAQEEFQDASQAASERSTGAAPERGGGDLGDR